MVVCVFIKCYSLSLLFIFLLIVVALRQDVAKTGLKLQIL